MITPLYARVMAAYNSEMNRRLYSAAARLTDAQRREDGGLYWGTLHATLNHLLWADEMWMSRFAGWPKPTLGLKQSGRLFERFDDLFAARAVADRKIEAWAHALTEADIAREIAWFSGASQSERRAPMSVLITHFFNHQTHHRGQATAVITRAGDDVGDTDLWLVVPEEIFDPPY